MRLTITPGILAVVLFLGVLWYYRYEHVTRELEGVSCVERVNRYTRTRCLVSDDISACRRLLSSRPCDN